MRTHLLPLLVALLGAPLAPAQGSGTLDGSWITKMDFSPPIRDMYKGIVLQERGDGRVAGYLPGSVSVWLTSGQITGNHVYLEFLGGDGTGPSLGGPFVASFDGTLSGNKIAGLFSDPTDTFPITWTRISKRAMEESWIFTDSLTGDTNRVGRVERKGSFAAGGFGGQNTCNFLACGGHLNSWDITGNSHSLMLTSSGLCPTLGYMNGTFDSANNVLSGTWTNTTCSTTTNGSFTALKEGLTDTSHVEAVLTLLIKFADRLEAESPLAIKAFSNSYLDNGVTKGDWNNILSGWFLSYDNLSATIETVSKIITMNDGETSSSLADDPRVDWHFKLMGTPSSGGSPVVLLEYIPFSLGGTELFYIGPEAGKAVFVGNGQ